MAVRFYFASLTAPLKSPGFAAWTRTSEGIRRTMSPVKDGSTLADKAFWANAAAAANDSCLCAQFVSPPLPAGVAFATTDTIRCVFRAFESAANDNINRQPIALLVQDLDYFKTVNVDYHDGLKYPHLERMGSTEDRLTAIISRK